MAAIPSLHAGLTLGIAAFLWTRLSRRWRPLLVAYVLVMAFTLVYTAEHYVVDILLGWVLAVVVPLLINWASRRKGTRNAENAGTFAAAREGTGTGYYDSCADVEKM